MSDLTNATRPKVIDYGVGEMGAIVTRLLVDKGVEIVGAIARCPYKVGRDLGEAAAMEKLILTSGKFMVNQTSTLKMLLYRLASSLALRWLIVSQMFSAQNLGCYHSTSLVLLVIGMLRNQLEYLVPEKFH